MRLNNCKTNGISVLLRLLGTNVRMRWQTRKHRLQLNLPGVQTVYFEFNKKDESIERIAQAEQTKLTSFFELNCQDKFAQTLLDQQIPEHYTWNNKQRKWKRRKKVLSEDHMPKQLVCCTLSILYKSLYALHFC